MKCIKFLFFFSFILMASVSFGQTEKIISPMNEGTVLTDADIIFLTAVSKVDLEASRGEVKKEATIGNVTYKAGQKLTNADARSITGAIMDFQKTYKTPAASRGAGLCYYWAYYCDGWGYCYYYKVWYYC